MTAACALVVSCKASVVKIGQPITMPAAVTRSGRKCFRSGKVTRKKTRNKIARRPAKVARPKVRVHGEKAGNANLTIGSVNEKIVTPKRANAIPR